MKLDIGFTAFDGIEEHRWENLSVFGLEQLAKKCSPSYFRHNISPVSEKINSFYYYL